MCFKLSYFHKLTPTCLPPACPYLPIHTFLSSAGLMSRPSEEPERCVTPLPPTTEGAAAAGDTRAAGRVVAGAAAATSRAAAVTRGAAGEDIRVAAATREG